MTYLEEDVETWEEIDSFLVSRSKGINVVNDPAERAVKLATYFYHQLKEKNTFKTFYKLWNWIEKKDQICKKEET